MSGTIIKRNKVPAIEKLRKYYLKGADKVILTEKQEEIRKRIELAWNLLCNYGGNYTAVVDMLMTRTGCSIAQAYRYVNDSESIFGNAIKNNAKAKQFLLEENIKKLYNKAVLNKDLALEHKALSLLNKAYGRNKEDDRDFNPEKFAAQTFIIKTDPAALEIMKGKSIGNAFDFNLLDSDEISYKEVKEDLDDE